LLLLLATARQTRAALLPSNYLPASAPASAPRRTALCHYRTPCYWLAAYPYVLPLSSLPLLCIYRHHPLFPASPCCYAGILSVPCHGHDLLPALCLCLMLSCNGMFTQVLPSPGHLRRQLPYLPGDTPAWARCNFLSAGGSTFAIGVCHQTWRAKVSERRCARLYGGREAACALALWRVRAASFLIPYLLRCSKPAGRRIYHAWKEERGRRRWATPSPGSENLLLASRAA